MYRCEFIQLLIFTFDDQVMEKNILVNVRSSLICYDNKRWYLSSCNALGSLKVSYNKL